jgi:HPt (histidine-containing phosphotransfer) domain-containing protein
MDHTLATLLGEQWPAWRPQELERVAVLERAVAKLGDALSESERRTAQEEAHRLAGTFAALGRPEAADGAREVERRLERRPPPTDAASLGALVGTLRAALDSDDNAPPLGSAP